MWLWLWIGNCIVNWNVKKFVIWNVKALLFVMWKWCKLHAIVSIKMKNKSLNKLGEVFNICVKVKSWMAEKNVQLAIII